VVLLDNLIRRVIYHSCTV